MPNKKIEIDLSDTGGNAYYLLALVDSLGQQLNMPQEVRKDIKNVMKMGSYDELLETFDIWFGEHVILYK
jgi:hypothetical protein